MGVGITPIPKTHIRSLPNKFTGHTGESKNEHFALLSGSGSVESVCTQVIGTVNFSGIIIPLALLERITLPESFCFGNNDFFKTEFVAPESTKNSISLPCIVNTVVGNFLYTSDEYIA